ncbi:hypothetical protein ACFOSC_03100 [Streptantibioticus rubrisoli]|uniref:GlsB/YeaQ/YmgE family stress response membrane protein n=1 Tax=Streptantibioticus rubrisoli TaxID=1387313 RepID=A0ABT1PC21_9ACTN|nr:hypothetical protein [Streptantibioticus rubrisoli]MCQ4042927.1 hypothetical protein [Streptantibioticus rubrisoli]
MVWAALGSAIIGLGAAWAALRLFPRRFPSRALTLVTGLVASLLGGVITRFVVGPGNLAVPLLAALGVGAALLSLLVRDPGQRRRSAVPHTA